MKFLQKSQLGSAVALALVMCGVMLLAVGYITDMQSCNGSLVCRTPC